MSNVIDIEALRTGLEPLQFNYKGQIIKVDVFDGSLIRKMHEAGQASAKDPKKTAHDALVAQLELDGADHADAEALDAVDLIAQDRGELLDLGLVAHGPFAGSASTADDLLDVVVRLAGRPGTE